MQNTYNKYDKLKHKKLIEQLFKDGKSVTTFPLRLVYLQFNHEGNSLLQAGVSVAKRNFKLAIDRNTLKRRIRESYRLNKQSIYLHHNQKYILMFIYIDKAILPSKVINLAMIQLLEKFALRVRREEE